MGKENKDDVKQAVREILEENRKVWEKERAQKDDMLCKACWCFIGIVLTLVGAKFLITVVNLAAEFQSEAALLVMAFITGGVVFMYGVSLTLTYFESAIVAYQKTRKLVPIKKVD